MSVVVRESCYPFYELSYTELSNGCSKKIQSFKRRQKEVERSRTEACAQLGAQIVAARRAQIFLSPEGRTQILGTEVEQAIFRPQRGTPEQR